MPKDNGNNDAGSPFNRVTQHDTKRAAIHSEASKLFNIQGSRATTLLSIAKGLGLSKTSLYYYVKTKEELIYQCYMRSVEHWQDTLRDATEQTDTGPEAIRFLIQKLFLDHWAAENGRGPYYAQLLEIGALAKPQRKYIKQRYRALVEQLQAIIHKGVEDGDIAPCEVVATTQALLGAIQWSFSWLHKYDKQAVLTAADSAWDIFLNGLAPQNGYQFRDIVPPAKEDKAINPGFDRQYQQRLKQEAFYKAGTAFFNTKGFSGTSLDEIAQELNVTKGAFYYHIKNKEDLLTACYERSIEASGTIYKESARIDDNGLAKTAYAMRRIFLLQISDDGPLIRYNSITALPMKKRKAILRRTRENRDLLLKNLELGLKDGSVRGGVDVDLTEHLLSGALNAAMEIRLWRDVTDAEQASAQYFNVFFNGLKPRVTA